MAKKAHISRRGFLKAAGAAGIGLVSIDVLSGCTLNQESLSTEPVVVDSDAATSVLEGYESIELTLAEPAEYELALGTVIFPAEGTWLPVLAAGDTSGKMNKAQCFSSASGGVVETLSTPINDDPNWVIFDVRCSDTLFGWVELNLVTRDWILYASAMRNGELEGTPAALWKGEADFDPPLFAISGKRVIWQVMPSLLGEKTREHSFCYCWRLGDTEAKAVIESPGRFATAPTISSGMLTITPRVRAEQGVFYGICAIDLEDEELSTIIDELVLPQSVRPFKAARTGEQFIFSIEANYNSGGLLGNMGTYLGRGEGPFISIPLEPSAGACTTPDAKTVVVRNRTSYLVVDLEKQTYAILGAKDRSLDYGEYPASEGETKRLVTFSTVKDKNSGYPDKVVVRIFDLMSRATDEEDGEQEDDASVDGSQADAAQADST